MIEVKDLVKKFGDKTVLNGINLHVAKGEVFGYLGPNGAGKTTTVRVILGLLKPTSGTALVDGGNVGEDMALKRRIGVVLEDDGLYGRLNAYENLAYYADLYDITDPKVKVDKIKELLDFAGLLPVWNVKIGTYSKGMKRKLAVARALVHDPDVLFLDEPTAGLDPEARKMVRSLISRLSKEKGITIFLNSHDLEEVQKVCHRIAILQQGEVRVCDTLANLRKSFKAPEVEITFADGADLEKALNLAGSLDYISDYRRDGEKLIATLAGNAKSSKLLNFLSEQGIPAEEVKRVTRSLEDIYLDFVHQGEGNE